MEELNKKIIKLFEEMGRGQGLNDSLLVEIFARLYFEPEPVAMEDLAKKTGYSLASISNKVNALGPVIGIQKIRKPGSKKIYISMEKDIMKIWKDALLKKQEYVINKVKSKVPEIIKEYKAKVKTEYDKRKLKNLENYYDQVIGFGRILDKILKEFE